jgi:predicted metal-dependent HD superfamily phosphohydrolase
MHLHKPDLYDVWKSLAAHYTGNSMLIEILYSELADLYREPHRFYHNLDHVAALVQLYFQYEAELKKPDAVLFSIFYHDAVYTPGRADNEYQSAQLAQRSLVRMMVPAEIVTLVLVYIEATAKHKLSAAADHDLKLFIDFDLSILAADQSAYRAYLQGIRKEYGYLSDDLSEKGRSAFLQQMLQKEHLFFTESFRQKEEAARKNMLWELQMSPGIYSAL